MGWVFFALVVYFLIGLYCVYLNYKTRSTR